MTKAAVVARYLLGLIFFAFGSNGFLHFMPQPPMSGAPADFMRALAVTGYMLTLVKLTQVLSGLLLLANRFVPLALALLAPVVVNIVAFHLFLDLAGLWHGVVVLLLEVFVAYAYRDAFAPMLEAKVAPRQPVA